MGALSDLIKEIAAMTPEEKATLAGVLGVAPMPQQDAVIPEASIVEIMTDLRAIYPNAPDEQLKRIALEQAKRPRQKQKPRLPRATQVYFFKQLVVMDVQGIEEDREQPGVLKKTAIYLPPRVIAVDEKQAWRLFWKRRRDYVFLGSSPGHVWARARIDGFSVAEAQKLEYDEMLKAPDRTPPMNREKTGFAGTKISQITRGNEIPYGDAVKQVGTQQ